eukprot:CAMPEP_0172319926 /NCGR_PEP_ID=MMETSP1058-20130122/39045_1 /TAXON_ID=83371 /ORGANISM="Detonula confervacea, Strain CCMP 353" /LENGTH=806 /DNA_ID=CAMNT_0013035071 /DNA_START=27 /DNA_END=2447 /DNA_ORIENTATION=-
MAALAASSSSSSSSSSHDSLLYSLPNWTRLTVTGDDKDALDDATNDAPTNNAVDEGVASLHGPNDTNATMTNLDANNGTESSTVPLLAPIATAYSTPRKASAAYQSGLLKSDFDISSNHPSIRLAFRHVLPLLKEAGKSVKSSISVGVGVNGDEEQNRGREEEDTLFLCWVRQDGIPCHFRPMHPVAVTDGNDDDGNVAEEHVDNAMQNEHGSLRRTTLPNEPNQQSSHNNATDDTPSAAAAADDDDNMLLVNENDHIETTFPGHAFVFCRRVKYDHSSGTAASTNDDGVGNESSRNDENEDPIVVNDDNGKTYFLRKVKGRRSDERSDKDADKSGSQEDEGRDVWEAFLVVGGFRPMPEVVRRDDESNEEEGKTEESDIEESDNDSDNDSDDGKELEVQLVTIQYTKTSQVKTAKATNMINADSNSNTETGDDDDDDDDDNLPSKVLGCSDCTQSVPFLRGAINPKPRHTPAFVATKTHNELELPPSHDNDGDQTANVAETDDNAFSLKVTVCTTRLDPTPLDTSSKHYDEVILGGWPCRAEPGCFPCDTNTSEEDENNNSSLQNSLQSRFEADILAASASLPPHTIRKLKTSTPIWINKSQSFGPKAAPVKARDGCFHPGSEWLSRNGMNPAKCGGVEWYDASHYLSDCDLWGPGGLMLHELSHAWHCLHIENGYDNEEILNVYNKAMEDGLYDCVRVHGRQGPSRCKAYACQDQMEYFAELSVAFLGGLEEGREHNKWYPFNRAQVREHDPRAFDMLCRMWGVVVVVEEEVEDDDDDSNSLSLIDDAESSARQEGSGEASKES